MKLNEIIDEKIYTQAEISRIFGEFGLPASRGSFYAMLKDGRIEEGDAEKGNLWRMEGAKIKKTIKAYAKKRRKAV